MTTIPFLDKPIITPFNQGKDSAQKTPLKNNLIGQTVFSTTFGFVACRLPFFQSGALGLATEGCRYVTDRAIDQLSTKFSFIRDNKTAVKTALVAGSFFLAKAVVNTILPGSSTLLGAGLLMSVNYLGAEPICRRIHEACNTEGKSIKQCLSDIKSDFYTKYPVATQKIANLWNYFFNQNRLDDDNT